MVETIIMPEQLKISPTILQCVKTSQHRNTSAQLVARYFLLKKQQIITQQFPLHTIKYHQKIFKASYNLTFQIHEDKEPKGEKRKRRGEGSDDDIETKSCQKYIVTGKLSKLNIPI